MYGILGEDESDVEMLVVLVRRLANDSRLAIRRKGYGGCGEMLRKGAKQLQAFLDLGCQRFIVAYDADGADPTERVRTVSERIVRPAAISGVCIIIPIQEIEAWILADVGAVSNVIPSWVPGPFRDNPESVTNAKERLEFLSRASNKRPRYSHATHNEKVAKYLDLTTVYQRCPSFRPLKDFVISGGSRE